MIDTPFPNGAGLIKNSVSQGSELLFSHRVTLSIEFVHVTVWWDRNKGVDTITTFVLTSRILYKDWIALLDIPIRTHALDRVFVSFNEFALQSIPLTSWPSSWSERYPSTRRLVPALPDWSSSRSGCFRTVVRRIWL